MIDQLLDSLYDRNSCTLRRHAHRGSSLSLLSGLIFQVFLSWMTFVTNLMLGGELLSCRVSQCWLGLNNMQAIVIMRLYPMYQQSRKILIFLFGIFLIVQIACVVIGAVQSMGLSGSKLPLCISDFCASGSRDNY